MTYNEPRPNPPRYKEPESDTSWMMWLGGLLALVLIVGGIVFATSNNTTTVAERPAATTGAAPTAGQGAKNPTAPPAQPAPAN